jgi:hypothetical protein
MQEGYAYSATGVDRPRLARSYFLLAAKYEQASKFGLCATTGRLRKTTCQVSCRCVEANCVGQFQDTGWVMIIVDLRDGVRFEGYRDSYENCRAD